MGVIMDDRARKSCEAGKTRANGLILLPFLGRRASMQSVLRK